MDITKVMRVVLAVATLLTTLAVGAGAVWSFATGKPPLLGITCTLLTVGFSFFVKNDYNYFFGKKS